MTRPPLPPFTAESAAQKARLAEDTWNTRDPAKVAASFPSNGRTLTDDAGDAFVAVLTNGKVTKDGVGPHSDLLAEFPYLGLPLNRWD
jgi:hypothetical protein